MTPTNDRLDILMLGESLKRPGGVVAVERATLESAPDRLTFHHIATLPPDGRLGQLRKLLTLVLAIFALARRLAFHRADVVHIHVSMGASIARKCLLARLAFAFDKPVVMHTHGGAFAEHYPAMPGWMQRFVRTTFRRCDAVITLAETWRRFYIDALGVEPERAIILKNPVKLPSAVPERSSAPPIHLLYLGMLSEPKGAFDLIEAMALLDDEARGRLHLGMAGHGEVDEASARVQEHGLQACITVRGWLGCRRARRAARPDPCVRSSLPCRRACRWRCSKR